MIMYSTRARISGQAPEAIAWAQSVAALVTKKSNVAVDVAARLGGHQDVIWVSRFDDLAHMEAQLDKIQSDAEYQKSVAGATDRGLFDIGSVETAIWRTL
ncbi:MAG TPA: hypothetical protein VN805_01795 [Caulobacteraceae bacterium]|nr:hypothetical protein [Caulobacteraceae bacterium]